MASRPHSLTVTFNGRHVDLRCGQAWLAEQLRARMTHLVNGPIPDGPPVLRVTVDELEPSWIEVRDSSARCERGSFDHVAYHVRKWVTGAFVAAHPDLLWLHAAAATTLEGPALLLSGPAGAGKSTLLVQLIERGWLLLADDVVGLVPAERQVLPLAFSPEVRATPWRLEEDWRTFLEQPKLLSSVAPARLASTPAFVGAMVFPAYAPDVDEPQLRRLTVVEAAHSLATQCLYGGSDKLATLHDIFRLARNAPCYRVRYRDPGVAAAALTERWFSSVTSASRGSCVAPAGTESACQSGS